MPLDPNEFRERTKRRVLSRAGYACSCPGCSAVLIGPDSDPSGEGFVLTGVAAHIRGAHRAPNNRYDPTMTPAERRHHSNAIALCEHHARLIDTDQVKYPVDLLLAWRANHEQSIAERQARGLSTVVDCVDKPYYQCTSEELRADRVWRRALLRKEQWQSFARWLVVFALLVVVVAGCVYYLSRVGRSFPVALLFLVTMGYLLQFASASATQTEFAQRQEAAIKEIGSRLRERGEE